jgi:hypothetical protein
VSGTFSPALQAILTSVRTTLAATPTGWPSSAREYVVPGQLAWDECECGLLAIEWLSAPYTSAFPSARPQTPDGCKPLLALSCRLTVLRCAPNPDGQGNAPTPADLAAAAVTNLDDLEAILVGMGVAVEALINNGVILDYSLDAPSPTGPNGGCVGVTQTFAIGFSNRWGPC